MFDLARLGSWTTDVRRQHELPLRVELWNGQRFDFSGAAPRVTIRVPNAAALRYLLYPSLYSLGRAYVEGAIEVSGRAADMIDIVNQLAHTTLRPSGRLGRIVRHFSHTRAQDRKAVQYHYDVSNDFYQAWLDPAMVYSCAYFENGDEDLATAQVKKIDHILNKLAVRPGHTLLDIGCGWGALAIRAAQQYGARVVGVTLSENQAQLARERVRQQGLAGRVEIRLQDYRDVQGRFDRITSVGMFEHVGVSHLPAYFRRIHDLLAEDGVAMNHGITSTDTDNGEAPYGGGQFIEQYVFPHGELAHLSTVVRCMQQGGLEVRDVENLRRHYARTCAAWTDRFESGAQQIRTLVEPKKFRIWHVYLAGCSYAFEHDWISLYQVVCGRAGMAASALPWSRRYMYQ